jgi:hypothetical protein
MIESPKLPNTVNELTYMFVAAAALRGYQDMVMEVRPHGPANEDDAAVAAALELLSPTTKLTAPPGPKN